MASNSRVLCTHKIPDVGMKILKKNLDVIILDEKLPIEAQLVDILPTVDYLISLLSVPITEELINSATSLKGIANYAVGYNNIDIKSALKKGILVTNTPDVNVVNTEPIPVQGSVEVTNEVSVTGSVNIVNT